MTAADSDDGYGFDTRAVHAGQPPDPATGAVVTPISLSTTFAQEGIGGHKGFEYSRSGNPTRAALEACVASLESARHGLAFASGLAAEDNVLRLVPPGGRVVLGNDAYGGTFRLIARVWAPHGMPWTTADVADVGLADRLRFTQNAAGAVPSPFDCYLVLRGVKTLAVRMERHCENARAVVDLLAGHPAVERVLYPQLPDHPGHAAAAKQMRDFGGMVSFTLRGGIDAAKRVAAATELFTLAESLGAVESLIEHPGAMTHASAAGSPLEVPDNLLRLSVGIEDGADLVADLAAALDQI